MATPWVPFAGYARLPDRIKAQIETMARDLARFLERLAKGEAVRAD